MKHNHRTCGLMFMFLMALASTATAADKQSIRVLFWTDGEGGPLNHSLEAGIEDFAPENADARLDELTAAGTPPDVFMTAAANLKKHVDAGKAYALNDELQQDPEWRSRFPDSLLRLLTVRGKTYALPIAQTVAIVYYNTEIFKKYRISVPATYAELKETVQVLSRNGVTPIAFANKEGWEGVLLSQLIENRLGGYRIRQNLLHGRAAAAFYRPCLHPHDERRYGRRNEAHAPFLRLRARS